MMDDESDNVTPIPIFVSQSQRSSENQTEFQPQQEFLSDRNEDSNQIHSGIGSFFLQLTFNGDRGTNWLSSIQFSSHSLENEARQCEEKLTDSQHTLFRLEAEVSQLERANKDLASDSEIGDLMTLERLIKRLEEELAQCRNTAISSSAELVLKSAAAKAIRTKRFETEHALRELQLSICRRKLEYATARALSDEDDGGDLSDENYFISVSNLPEEEERITTLQKELGELTQLNTRALLEAKEAELLDDDRQRELTRAQVEMEQRISMNRSECEARRQNLEEKRRQIKINKSYLVTLGEKTVNAKLEEITLLQQIALIDAARKVKNLEFSAQNLMGANISQYNG